MQFLRTNTATRVTIGPFYDITDGVTPELALTVTNEKLTFIVDSAGVPTLVLDTAPTASGGNNDMVHITGDDSGFYDLELTAANTNYVGRARLSLTDANNHLPVFHEYMILSAQAFDALCGTGNFYADIQTIKTQAVTCAGGVTIPAATLASTTNITAGTITTTTNLTNAPTAGDLTATMKASVTTAASAATPVVTISRTSGAVATDAGNAANIFKTNLASAVDNFWKGAWLKLTSGVLSGQVRKVSAYNGTTKVITVSPGFTGIPADAVTFVMVNE